MLENLCLVIEQLSIILCLFALYGKKFKLDIYTMAVIVINVTMLYIKYLGYLNETSTILIAIIVFIYCLYEFDKNIKLAIINNVLYLLIISIFQLLNAFAVALLKNFLKNDVLVFAILNLLIMILVILIGKRFNVISKYICKRQWLSLVPIFICCAMIIVLLLKFKSYEYLQFEIYAISMVFIILVIVLVQKWFESKAELEAEQLKLKIANVYNEAFEKLVADIRRQQHDVKNHLNAIYSQHYTQKTYEDLVESQKEYCDYILESTKYNKLLSIPDPILAGFLYSRFIEIEDKGIEIEYSIELSERLMTVPVYEIISLVGILIDNAVEKVESIVTDKRKIKFNIVKKDDKVCIYVKNVSEYIEFNAITRMFEEGVSSKGENRGIGLYNIKEKSRKYGFDISVQNEMIDEENWISFGLLFDK